MFCTYRMAPTWLVLLFRLWEVPVRYLTRKPDIVVEDSFGFRHSIAANPDLTIQIYIFPKTKRQLSVQQPHYVAALSVALQPNSGLGLLIFEVPISHTISHTHPVGLLWRSDQLVAETATYTTHNKPKRRISLPSAGFEPATSASKRPQTYGLDRTDTGIGSLLHFETRN